MIKVLQSFPRAIFALAWVLVLSPPAGLHAQEAALEEEESGWLVSLGDPVPSYELKDTKGNLHTLEELAGNPAVIVFWGTW